MILLPSKENKEEIARLEQTFPELFQKHPISVDFKRNPFTRYYYATYHNQILAVMNYTLLYDRMELIDIYVLPEFRHRRVGAQLLEQLIKDANRDKVKNITLEVREDNVIAIHLYENYGFKRVAKRKGYYDGVDAILMEKEMI